MPVSRAIPLLHPVLGDASTPGGADAAPRGRSQNGWPASAYPDEIGIVSVPVALRGGTRTIRVARAAAPTLVAMIRWWDQNVEPVTELGGYDYRNVRGYASTISNHGSGTAVDVNASRHPLGEVGTVSDVDHARIALQAAALGLRWGGTYRGRKDEMHVEVASGPVEAVLAPVEDAARQVEASVAREAARIPTATLVLAGVGAALLGAGIVARVARAGAPPRA